MNFFPAFSWVILQFTRERTKLPKRFRHHSMCFSMMHIVSKFQCFIHIFTMEKLENMTPTFKMLKKKRNLKNGLSYNIGIGLILKIVHWRILSSNLISVEK